MYKLEAGLAFIWKDPRRMYIRTDQTINFKFFINGSQDSLELRSDFVSKDIVTELIKDQIVSGKAVALIGPGKYSELRAFISRGRHSGEGFNTREQIEISASEFSGHGKTREMDVHSLKSSGAIYLIECFNTNSVDYSKVKAAN